MISFAGRYFWWAVGLFVLAVFVFATSTAGPHLRVGPAGATSSIDNLTKLITAIAGLVGAIGGVLGAIDKIRGKKEEIVEPTKVDPTASPPPQIGERRERIVGYRGDYEVVRLAEWDGRGWWILQEYERRRQY